MMFEEAGIPSIAAVFCVSPVSSTNSNGVLRALLVTGASGDICGLGMTGCNVGTTRFTENPEITTFLKPKMENTSNRVSEITLHLPQFKSEQFIVSTFNLKSC